MAIEDPIPRPVHGHQQHADGDEQAKPVTGNQPQRDEPQQWQLAVAVKLGLDLAAYPPPQFPQRDYDGPRDQHEHSQHAQTDHAPTLMAAASRARLL